ncbi:MAG: YbjN domain-containing protein [Chloroflexia bacterium]|nr:YbjN domain-containing protein [Chloroflexia bacterium]
MSEVTMDVLKLYLERFGWSQYDAKDEEQEQEGIIYTGWRSSEEGPVYRMTIDPMAEKKCLSFKVHQLAKAPKEETSADRLTGLLMVLGWVNYSIILGKFGYDHRDGEVRFSVDVPIDVNDFTYEQFAHAMIIAIRTVEEWALKLQAYLAGEKELGELLA